MSASLICEVSHSGGGRRGLFLFALALARAWLTPSPARARQQVAGDRESRSHSGAFLGPLASKRPLTSGCQDENEALDLSDNEIVSLSNFPLLLRLRTLFCGNNLVAHVAPGIGKALPGLEVLVLVNNDLSTLGDVAALGELPHLTHLALGGNPVTAAPHYRAFVVHTCPALESLDFSPVTRKERFLAGKFFAEPAGQAVLSSLVKAGGVSAVAAGATSTKRLKLDEQQRHQVEAVRARIRNAIMQAESIDDLAKLQAALREPNHTEAFMEQLEAIERDIATKSRP